MSKEITDLVGPVYVHPAGFGFSFGAYPISSTYRVRDLGDHRHIDYWDPVRRQYRIDNCSHPNRFEGLDLDENTSLNARVKPPKVLVDDRFSRLELD